jgi:hypothetical protein
MPHCSLLIITHFWFCTFSIWYFLLFEGVGGTSSFNYKFKLLQDVFKIKFFSNMFLFFSLCCLFVCFAFVVCLLYVNYNLHYSFVVCKVYFLCIFSI